MINSLIYKIRKHHVKHFFFKLLLLTVIVFMLDLGIGKLLRYFYFRQESGLQYRTTQSMEKTTADLLIFGASRANHHYHPEVFEDRLHMSYYNAGRDGNYIFYHYAVLKSVLKRYKPKVIILDVINFEFKPDQESYDRISSLLPYYHSHPEIRPIVQIKGPYEKLKLISSIYPYNSSMFTIAVGNTELNKRMGDIKGYVPLDRTWSGGQYKEVNTRIYELDSVKLEIFESFVRDCRDAGSKLYIVCSPYYANFNFTDHSIMVAEQLAKKYNVPFIDYSKDPFFSNSPKWFADPFHLNDAGARIFSNMVIDRMSVHSPIVL